MTVEEILSGFIPDESATNTISFGGGLAFDNIRRPDQAEVSPNFNPLAMVPARHRRSDAERYLAFAKDAFDYVSGLDPKGFLGKTEQMMNNYDKMRMEEDPEGYQIDMNRAKSLSQRAYATNDPELKKKYGAAIKQLLPRETQGMDDLTASEFLIGNEKLDLEKIKAANRLAVQALKNQGGLDTAGLKADSAERIASMKAENALEIKMLDGEMKQALKDKDFEKAAMIQDKIMERTIAAKEMDFDREVMKQGAATERTNIQQEGAYNRVIAQNAGALERVNAQQEGQNYRTDANNKTKIAVAMMKPIGGSGSGGGKGTAKEREANELVQYRLDNWDEYIAKQDADLGVIDRAIQVLEENPSATGLRTYLGMSAGGLGISPATERAYGELNEKTTQMVLDIVKQLNAAGATSSVFNSPAEQEKIIGDIINPRAPYNARLAAYKSFRDRLKRYYENERKMVAWKGSKMGMSIGASQPVQPHAVSASEVNNNSRVIDGGVEW